MLGVFSTGLLLGALLSATVLWLLSGLLSPIPDTWTLPLTTLAAAAGVARDAGILPLPLPQNSRQVPQDVLQRDLVRGALQFGFEMGTGVRTYVSATLPYVLAVGLLLAGDAQVALLAGTGFAAGRAATPLLRYAARTGEHWDDRLQTRLPLLKLGGGTILTAALLTLTLRTW